MRLPVGDDCQKTTEEDFSELLTSMELLPVEVAEIILSYLRPADLVSVAASSPHLQLVSRSARLWRQTTVQLSGDDVRSSLRQIELASELGELQAGFDKLSSEAADAISRYEGPVPHIRKLRLGLSTLGTDLGAVLLSRHGRKARQIELDLCHGPLEPPRNNIALITRLPDLPLEGIIIRTDAINDIIVLSQLALRLVEIDVRHLRVGDVLRGGPGPAVGATAAHLISRHLCHLQTLSLPLKFDASLSSVVLNCRELRILACNVWTLPAIEHLSHLQSLVVYPPDYYVSSQDILVLMDCARRSRSVLTKLKELRFVGSGTSDLLSPVASPEIAQAVICTLLAICKSLEVIEVGWKIKANAHGQWSWLDALLSNNAFHLRELWFHGNLPSPRHLLSLAKYCPHLQILDVRTSDGNDDPAKDKTVNVSTKGAGMVRALTLLQQALPKLTILFDDVAETSYDWNSYLDPQEKSGNVDTNACLRPLMSNGAVPSDGLDRLFNHLLTLDQWVSSGGFVVPPRGEIDLWRCATLDSALWSNQHFSEILSVVPALGLVDCRNDKALRPGKKGHQWIKSLARGPTHIRALRLRAVLVSSDLWGLVVPVLQRVKKSLHCLELDFRGRPYRNWREVLNALGSLPNLTEFVLRGVFDDEKPVLDWLHGRVRSLSRLDLRDCLMVAKQMPEFFESLQKLLVELRGSLRAVALPPLPRSTAASVLATVSELTDLREVALHANELGSLRPLTSLCALELYGDRRPRNKISLELLARAFRETSDTLRSVEYLTLPADLVTSHLVQEAICDVMPNLRELDVIYPDRKLRLCAQGPRCRTVLSKLL